MNPPPRPVAPARTSTPNRSRSLRMATSAPDMAKTKMPRRSRLTRIDIGLMEPRLSSPTVARRRRSPGAERGWRRLIAHRRRIHTTRTRETMLHLTLAGLSEDKKRLLLVSDKGEEFSLAVDDRLRAALRGEHARLGQLEIQMESTLRPRDIQARIRAGESPESVAQAAHTTAEKILPFANPVLAEREHIAHRAQRSPVRTETAR